METIEYQLKHVSSKHRSKPFWAWNDALEKEEICRQIKEMDEQGMGGFFIHSREGLETPYLSDEWMDLVSIAVDEGKKRNMDVWIYDDDKWPSGSGGGLVSTLNEKEYAAKAITLEVSSEKTIKKEGLIEDYLIQYKDGSESYIAIYQETSNKSDWYNQRRATDMLNKKAVAEFIRQTHERYKKALGQDFSKKIKGFFTDEPNCCDFFSTFTEGRPWLPWTSGFDTLFVEKRGYSIRPYLPLLFIEELEKINKKHITYTGVKIRHDYFKTLTEVFLESYMKQVYEWCEKNNVELTGHLLYENDLGYLVRGTGAPMPHYQYMHVPGIDILGEQIEEYLTVKQCTSVAHQLGRKEILSETYGCTGWDFDFQGQKWLFDWQAMMGVTMRCQHLALYSIAGCRKRDYPPAFSYQTTWWKENQYIEEYMVRMLTCSTYGRVKREIAVLHPIGTIWMESGSHPQEDFTNIEMNMGWKDDHITRVNKLGDTYNQLAKLLLSHQLDFDFIDEFILKNHGEIRGSQCYVGEATYKEIVIPEIKTLFAETVDFLLAYLEQGGSIVWVGDAPICIDGEENKKIHELTQHEHIYWVQDNRGLVEYLETQGDWDVQFYDVDGNKTTKINSVTRVGVGEKVVLCMNLHREECQNVEVVFKGIGEIKIYSPLKDMYMQMEGNIALDKQHMYFNMHMDPGETLAIIVKEKKVIKAIDKKVPLYYRHPHSTEKIYGILEPKAPIALNMDNVLTLDQCRYKVEGDTWSEVDLVWKNQRRLREKFGFKKVFFNGLPQRYTWIEEGKIGKKVSFEFMVEIQSIPESTCKIVVEKSEGMMVTINGYVCQPLDTFFLDISFNEFWVPKDVLIKGRNTIRVSCIYKEITEFEDIYFVGAFGVDVQRRIVPLPKSLCIGDWTMQGLYHYPGHVTYFFECLEQDVRLLKQEKIFLKMPKFGGTMAKITVNGSEPQIVFTHNTYVDVTEFILEYHEKCHQVCVEIIGSPRNMFGPFHQKYLEGTRISWEDFRTEGILETQEYMVKPQGIFAPIYLVIS